MSVKFTDNRIIISLFSLKLSFRKRFKNNRISVIMPNGKIERKRKIRGLKVLFKNDESSLVLHYPIPVFKNCQIILRGGNAIFQAKTDKEKANNTIKNLVAEVNKNAILEIGENFYCRSLTMVIAENCKLEIGSNCLFADNILIRTGDGHPIYQKDTKEIINKPKDIKIGNNVWIGINSTILKNAKILDYTIIGANSVVTKSFDEPNIAIAGNPAKVIKQNVQWSKSYSDSF